MKAKMAKGTASIIAAELRVRKDTGLTAKIKPIPKKINHNFC